MGNQQTVPVNPPTSINNPNSPRPGYYINKSKVMYSGKELVLFPGEELNSVKKLKHGYFVTNQRVFYKGNPIPGASPYTFKTVERPSIESEFKDLGVDKVKVLKRMNSVLGMDVAPNGTKRVYQFGRLINL